MTYKLDITVSGVPADTIPNCARFANYIGAVVQINGSLIENVNVIGAMPGPETTSADGKVLNLGARALPSLAGGSPSALGAWCGAAFHGMGHSKFSPRSHEPLRPAIQQAKLHRLWNMIEDPRIERLMIRTYPGWQPHFMAAVNHILLKPREGVGQVKPNLSSVYPLLVGRTYLPLALRQESYRAFADEHSEYIADAVRDLIFQYMGLFDPGTADCDEAVSIVKRLAGILGKEAGTDCGSHDPGDSDDGREWTDPGDPSEDDEDEGDDEGGNPTVTDDDDADDTDEDGEGSDGGDDDTDEDGEDGDGESGDTDSDGEDAEGTDGDGDADEDGDDGEAGSGGDGEAGDDGEVGDGDDDGDATGDEDGSDDDDTDDEVDGDGGAGSSGGGNITSRLEDWTEAIDSAVAQDEALNDLREAVLSGPMPMLKLREKACYPVDVPVNTLMAEQDIARELRVLMDGARPGMRRRIDRGRFNVTRVVREGGMTRPEEMFDRHDPGAMRASGLAMAFLVDVSSSMLNQRSQEYSGKLPGAMQSLWCVDRAVASMRGAFKAWSFGMESQEMPRSEARHLWAPTHVEGSTKPVVALNSAFGWLSQQKEPNKLCIIATDGAWDGYGQCHEVIRSMIANGYQVAIFGIDCDVVSSHGRSGAKCINITSAADLGPAVGEMMVGRVKSALRRR